MKTFIASFVKGQILLFAPQLALILLILYDRVSFYYGAPVVISLAVLWGWFDYSGKAQRRGASVLKKLERLVDDFGWLNFQEGGGAGSEKVAEETLRLVAKGDLTSLESEREGFSTFKTRLAELRGRANAFLQSLRDDGLPVSETKVRALEVDPWFKTGTEISETKQSPQ